MNRLRSLDGLRGIAILMVVAGHAITHYQPLGDAARGWLVAFANPGQGVRIFFALSGYLITHLLLREMDASGRVDLADFWLRRTRRILPAFAVFMGALAAWGLYTSAPFSWPHWTAAATFTWNYAQPWLPATRMDGWIFGHTWSLAVEAQFYLLWPLVLVRLGARRALLAVLLFFALQPFIRLGTYALFPGLRGYLGIMLHTGADGILAGCAAALLCRRQAFLAAFARHSGKIAAVSIFWILIAGPVLVHSIRGFSIVAGFTLDALAAVALVVWLHHAAPAPARAVTGRGALPLLGLVSYSLYLWQQVFLRPGSDLAEGRPLVPVIGALLAAIISYLLIERPFLARPRPTRTLS